MTLDDYIQAAWLFASSILWPDKKHTDEDVRKTLLNLQDYFTRATDLGEAFNTLCGRVMLASANKKRCPILHPRIWLNPMNLEGLTATDTRPDLKAMSRKLPGFDKIVSIITSHFLEYKTNPSSVIFLKCQADLNDIGQLSWLDVFNTAIKTLIKPVNQ